MALISLFIAVTSLAYNSWRNETSEEQRNIRHAGFTVLEQLGEMQEVVDARYYYLARGEAVASEGELRLRGYGSGKSPDQRDHANPCCSGVGVAVA